MPEQWLKQPYNYYLKGLGGVRWDKKKFPNPNLHVYDRDETKIIVYNMEMWPKEREDEKKSRDLRNNTLNSCNQDQELYLMT